MKMARITVNIEVPEDFEDAAIEHNISKSELSQWLGECSENILDDVKNTIEDILEWKGVSYE